MHDRAKFLLSYLYLARFVDRRTRNVDIRVLLHNEPADVLVDVHVNMRVSSQGEISATTESWKVPLFDYFDGSSSRLGLFILEALIAGVAVALCVSSIGDARRFARLLYDSVVRRLQQRVVRRHFVMDAWTLAVEALQLAIPICLLAASVVHFVYFFAYVRDFTYERSYRWYDGDGSAAARILLPKRSAEPQPPVEGYPRGAWRHTLEADTSERDAYLSLLDEVDAMTTLNGWYLVLQVPILLGIAANIVRHFFGLPMMYPYLRTLQRSLPNMVVLVGIIALVTVQCAYAFHLLLGDRFEPYARVHHAIETLSEYQIGESSALVLHTVLGKDKGTLVNANEYLGIVLVRFFYPVAVAFLLLQFVVAVLLDFFTEERERRIQRELLARAHATADDKLAAEAMRASGVLDRMRDAAAAFLYSLGLKNSAAFVFSGNAKWLDPSRGLRGFQAVPKAQAQADMSEAAIAERSFFVGGADKSMIGKASADARAYFQSLRGAMMMGASSLSLQSSRAVGVSARDRWRNVRRQLLAARRGAVLLEAIIKRSDDVRDAPIIAADGDGDYVAAALAAHWTGDVRKDGLKNDTARYLRMNQTDRQELIVPSLGLLGPTALGEVLAHLHALASRATAETAALHALEGEEDDTEGIAHFSLDLLVDAVEQSVLTLDQQINENKTADENKTAGVSQSATEDTPRATAMENLLYRFAKKEDRKRLRSTTLHLVKAKREQFERETCIRVAHRVVHDIGWRAGTEFDRLHGEALTEAVLKRARDTAKGMAAVTADMLALSSSLRAAVRATRNASPQIARMARARSLLVQNKIMRKVMSYTKGDVVDNAWRLGTDVIGAVTEVPWRLCGMMLSAMRGNLMDRLDDSAHQDGRAASLASLVGLSGGADYDAWGEASPRAR